MYKVEWYNVQVYSTLINWRLPVRRIALESDCAMWQSGRNFFSSIDWGCRTQWVSWLRQHSGCMRGLCLALCNLFTWLYGTISRTVMPWTHQLRGSIVTFTKHQLRDIMYDSDNNIKVYSTCHASRVNMFIWHLFCWKFWLLGFAPRHLLSINYRLFIYRY
jgi:hypothetical protein